MTIQFDFTAKPDYSGEEYEPDGTGKNLHFLSRFLVTFFPENQGRLVDLVALTHYTHLQHSRLEEEYHIQEHAIQEGTTLYGFWAGFDHEGNLKICSSGSESLRIPRDEELDSHFLSSRRVVEKLKLIMPNIKALGSIVFKRFC